MLGKLIEQILLQVMLRHTKYGEVVFRTVTKPGFTKGKCFLTNPVAFYNGVTHLRTRERVQM